MIGYILFALIIAEFASIILWFVPYYKHGLSVYTRQLKKYNSVSEFESDESVVIDERSGYFLKDASPTTMLFWELPLVFLVLAYVPTMRGVITYNNASNALEVQGKLNVSILPFLLYIAVSLGNGTNYFAAWGIPISIWILSYLIQYLRFSSYATEIERSLA